jgi:tetratricopeptide (TPR) repeat protein
MRLAFVLALLIGGALPALAQSVSASGDARGQAYFEFLLARRLEAAGDTTGAQAALKRALSLDPKSAELHAELAGFFARQNKAGEAIEAAERALVLDANNAEAHRMLGLVYAAWSDGAATPPTGQTQAQLRAKAIEHLTKILDTPSVATDLNLQLTLARLHLRAGNTARAVPLLENIVSQAPFATEPHTLLAEARLNLGQVDAAIDAMEAAAELNPRFYTSLGELYERQQRWPEAVEAYEQAIANARGGPSRDLRLRYAAALLNTGDAPSATKARDVLKEFLVTAPQDARGLFLLASANLRLGDAPGAEEAARRLIALDPTSIQGMHALSSALIARKQYPQVIELLTPFTTDRNRAKGRESDVAMLLAQLAHAHTQLGNHSQAVTVLTTALAHDPVNAVVLNSLGYTLAERGERLTEAVEYIERALKIDPENPSYLDSLGWALFKQGRVKEAEPHLRRAADALPTNSVVQDHYGDLLATLGRHQEAIAAWERALKGDGEDIEKEAIEKKLREARARKQ